MPDGDIVHNGLTARYQSAYKGICDGQFGGDELANKVILAVWRDIEDGGDGPIQLLKEFAERAQQIRDRWFEQVDWQKEFDHINELARPIYAQRRWKTLAVEACQQLLFDLRNGGNPSKCSIELLKKYTWNVYVTQFEERVPLKNSHDKGVSQEFIRERLAIMQPSVQEKLAGYVEQMYREGTVHIQKKPRRRLGTKPHYDVDTDLSSVGA